MRKLYLLFILLLALNFSSSAQKLPLSVYSEVSIFTCGPGDALFETFGHNAIRVKDPMLRLDVVFNYGTFDFRDPNFYTNFAEGRLEYWVSVSRYERFEASYRAQERWMKEQVLDLTQEEKQAFFDFLSNNALPENRNYFYDPFFDNCSTKLRDITESVLNSEVKFASDYALEERTLREVMNRELPWNTWGSFGINTALGSKLDRVMTSEEYMYLPDYLYLAFKDSKRMVNGNLVSFVKQENIVIDAEERSFDTGWLNPMIIFGLLFLLVLVFTYKDLKKRKRSRVMDFFIFFLTGLVGVFLIYLWFFTDHRTTPNNFNVLWAYAPNVIVAFLMIKKKIPNWLYVYSKLCFALMIVMIFLWILKVQVFTWAILPVIGILLIRYGYLGFLLTSKE